MSRSDLTYLLWLLGALAPTVALYLNARALSLSSYFQLCDKFSDSFRRLRDCEDDRVEYEFGELLNLTENACHLYRSWVVWGTTRSLLGDYLVDVINGVNNQPSARRAVTAGMTGDRTYNEINRFAEAHKIPFLERK